jgi:hypothetical protein
LARSLARACVLRLARPIYFLRNEVYKWQRKHEQRKLYQIEAAEKEDLSGIDFRSINGGGQSENGR